MGVVWLVHFCWWVLVIFFSLSVATILDAGLGHFFSHFPLQQFWMLDLVIFFSLPIATMLDEKF